MSVPVIISRYRVKIGKTELEAEEEPGLKRRRIEPAADCSCFCGRRLHRVDHEICITVELDRIETASGDQLLRKRVTGRGSREGRRPAGTPSITRRSARPGVSSRGFPGGWSRWIPARRVMFADMDGLL